MRRIVRTLAIGVALASTLTLTACDKPAPKLTLQTGAFSTTVGPTTYAFDSTHLRTYSVSLPEVTAKTDATVLIDVPRKVAHNGWAVTAISLNAKHTVLGDSGEIKNQHSYRVAAQSNNGSPFIVRVSQLRNGKADGSVWGFLVKVSDAT